MADRRQGLNATLYYKKGASKNSYDVRVSAISHGMKVIFSESQSRIRKAFYPHRLSSAQFMIQVDLVGEQEYVAFSSWMASYASYALTLDSSADHFAEMGVSVPSRDFLRKGVPLAGFEWGDKVGKMAWSPQIVFETSEEPLDLTKGTPAISQDTARDVVNDPSARYYYPGGYQLVGQAPPDGTYSRVITAASLSSLVLDSPETHSGRGGRGPI